jgi:hypothetical protein
MTLPGSFGVKLNESFGHQYRLHIYHTRVTKGWLRGFAEMIMMTIISPFGQLGLWAPSSMVRDVSISTAYVFVFT